MFKSRVTLATCLLCTLVYILELALGGNLFNTSAETLLNLGGSTGPLTLGQMQLGRLINCIFIHANLLHLALNLYVLIDFGPLAEASLGSKLYAFVFLFCGAVGALTSILYSPTQTSVGASAAILGLLGALIYKSWFGKDGARFSRPQLMMLCIFLLYSLLLGFTSNVIDNAAHLGGFFAGMLVCAAIFGTKPERAVTTRRLFGATVCLLLLIPTLIFIDSKRVFNNPEVTIFQYRQQALSEGKKSNYAAALNKLNKAQDLSTDKVSSILLDRAEVLEKLDQDQAALNDIDQWLTKDKQGVHSLGLKSLILHKLNRNTEAIESVTQALDVKPAGLMDFFNGHGKNDREQAVLFNNRAWFELAHGQINDALADCDKSLALEGKTSATYDTRGVAYLLLKDFDQAQKDFNYSIALSAEERNHKIGATEDGGTYYHRAIARKALGDKKNAREDMERFKSLDYKPEAWEPKP